MIKKEKCFPSCCLQQMTPAYKGANPSVCNGNLSSFRSLKTLPELYSMTRTTGWLNASSRTEEAEPERRYLLLASCPKRAKWGFPPLSQTRLQQATADLLAGTRGHLGQHRGFWSTSTASRSSLGLRQWGSWYANFGRHLRKSNGLGSYSYSFVLSTLDISSPNFHGPLCAVALTRRARRAAEQAGLWFWHSKEQVWRQGPCPDFPVLHVAPGWEKRACPAWLPGEKLTLGKGFKALDLKQVEQSMQAVATHLLRWSGFVEPQNHRMVSVRKDL